MRYLKKLLLGLVLLSSIIFIGCFDKSEEKINLAKMTKLPLVSKSMLETLTFKNKYKLIDKTFGEFSTKLNNPKWSYNKDNGTVTLSTIVFEKSTEAKLDIKFIMEKDVITYIKFIYSGVWGKTTFSYKNGTKFLNYARKRNMGVHIKSNGQEKKMNFGDFVNILMKLFAKSFDINK